MKTVLFYIFLVNLIYISTALLPPKFQWKVIDFTWRGDVKNKAMSAGTYIPENNMPSGLASWKDKLFITIPRWKKGVPSSLNFVYLNGTQQELLQPYPNWDSAYTPDSANCPCSNASVISAFRAHVDRCDRLWVADNGATGMTDDVKQITDPAVLVFDLKTDRLLHRYELTFDVLRDSSVLTSIVVDVISKSCDESIDSFAYITDMGSNAIIVYSLKDDDAWRVENHYFHFDPHAGIYKVSGLDFYWSDGVSSATLSNVKKDGFRDLYFHPTSSTKQFKMSTRLLRDKHIPKEDIFNGVEVVGERGPFSQASACDFEPKNSILFYTQLCKNAIGCWNTEKPFNPDNVHILMKDCHLFEFPSDVKVDNDGNLWVLSNCQARFLYDSLDLDEFNYRVLTAPVSKLVKGTPCEKMSMYSRALTAMSITSKKSKC